MALPIRVACDLTDLVELLSGRARPLTPPRRMWALVGARDRDFHSAGQGLADLLIRNGLSREHRVLDVGSGIGRLALPLTRYLSLNGAYDGIEIMPDAVAWCQRTITPQFPNFRFHAADVRNDRYNPRSRASASTYVFPFDDASFDVVLLASVFTHMLAPDMRNYMAQIGRVLRPGGVSIISYYILDDERRANIAHGSSGMSFEHRLDGCRCEFADLPEAAVAYERADVEACHAVQGLRIDSITLGAWDRTPVQDQDIVVARRTA